MTTSLAIPDRAAQRCVEPVVTVRDLAKSYGDRQVLDGLSFTVFRGEIFGILGPNGAGKTTAVEIVQGLRDADVGSVQVSGIDPGTEPRRLRGVVGSQLQSAALPERIRVGEAVRLFARLAGDVVDWQALMDDWDLTRLERSAFRDLSGGERQRLFLALALVGAPEVVILDELTQGLDPAARRQTWRLIERVRDEGATVVLVSHYMDEVERLCDRVGVLRGGRMDAIASPREIVRAHAGPVRTEFSAPPGLAGLLSALPGVQELEEQRASYVVTGDGGSPVRVAALLAGRDLWPADFHTERATLEDIFVALTTRDQG
jgi:ABC-2 type transport system ATP-binding protein